MFKRILVLLTLVCMMSACGGPEQANNGEGWELLGSELSESDPVVYLGGDLLVSFDEASYRENWASGHMSSSPPPVNFDTHIVVRSDRFSNEDCNDVVFEGFSEVEDGTVSLEFLPPDGRYCRSFGFGHVVFVALEKASLPPEPFELRDGEGHGAITVPIENL